MCIGQNQAADNKARQTIGRTHPDGTARTFAGVGSGEQAAFVYRSVTRRDTVVVDHVERRWYEPGGSTRGATTNIDVVAPPRAVCTVF